MRNRKEWVEPFDVKAYQVFIKDAFKKADGIEVYINKPVNDRTELAVGRLSFLGNNILRVKNCDDNRMNPFKPYAFVEVKKNFEVLEALERIQKWTDFYGEDEESDAMMLYLAFRKEGKEIAYISSHFVGYQSEFGWL